MRSDAGNSFVLEPIRQVEVYLGHEVEVNGTESPTMSTDHEQKENARHMVTLYHGSEKQTMVYSTSLCHSRVTLRIYYTEAGGSAITELGLHY